MITTLGLFLTGLAVGGLGSMLGIGGGALLIPILTGFGGLEIKTAIGTSLVCVIATSSAAGSVYVERGWTHTRLAMVLEIATTAGALAGGITAVLIQPKLLEFGFGFVLLYVVYNMRNKRRDAEAYRLTGALDTGYHDLQSDERIEYGVHHLPHGLAASFFAGNISGLLGIGGGIVKVPIMYLLMGVPLRAAIATSNFMIGVTAAAGAIIYYQHGFVSPYLAAPTAIGVLLGARFGPRFGGCLNVRWLKQIFRLVLLIFALRMFWHVMSL